MGLIFKWILTADRFLLTFETCYGYKQLKDGRKTSRNRFFNDNESYLNKNLK